MVVIRQVKVFDLPALFSPKPGNVKCSVDNRALILHRKGVTIYEVPDDPCPVGSDVVVRKTVLDIPKKVESLSAGPAESVLVGGNKKQILELLKDRVITPRGYIGIEFDNYFTKTEWSLVRVANGPVRKPRCLLATITSNFQMVIYGQKEDEDIGEDQNSWVALLNLTKLYNNFLLQQWTVDGDSEGLRFQQYRSRLYELNCVDFAWMPQFEKVVDELEGVSELFFITAQANGTVVIWWILVSGTEKSNKVELKAEPVFQQNVFDNEIISTMKFHKLSETSGMLALGTCGGAVRVFRIEKLQLESSTENERTAPGFAMGLGIEIWEKDLLSVEYFDFVEAEEINILKSRSVDLFFVKHPFYACSGSLTLCQDEIVCGTVNAFPIPEGTIVGIDRYSEDLFMICHETGTLSLVYLKNGSMRYLEASANSIRDVHILKRDNFAYNGFAFSSNKALAFVGKNLKCPFDHNAEKDPGKFIMFSTLPLDAWDFVKKLYVQRNYSLTKIADALLDFRSQIRVRKDYDVDQYLDDPENLEIARPFLRLYYWVLRCIQLPVAQDFLKDDSLIEKRAKILCRQAIIEDTLVQNHFLGLIHRLQKDKLRTFSLTELQAICAIQTYLKSKPHLANVSFLPTPPAIKPRCPICTEDIDFKDLKYEPWRGPAPVPEVVPEEHPFPGYVWNLQRCTRGHDFPICILTLLPCEENFRTCSICHVVALENPGFERKPKCPLCGTKMLIADVFIDGDEEVSPEEEDLLRSFADQMHLEPEFLNVDVDVKPLIEPLEEAEEVRPSPAKKTKKTRGSSPAKKVKVKKEF